MNELISICITLFNRPDLLKEAIESCLAQSYRPLEIIVGDDSFRSHRDLLEGIIASAKGVAIAYAHHVPALGEAENVNDLFGRARGARLLLLHDDDLLCRGCLDELDRAWHQYPGARCVFGKYLIVDQSGKVMQSMTLEQNSRYFRIASNHGRQPSGARVGLQQQFPHNGYLIESSLAREVRYRPRHEVGLCADFDFGIRLGNAIAKGQMVYIDRYISKYRLSFPSTLRTNPNLGEHLLFRLIREMPFDRDEERYREQALIRMSQGASLSAALSRDIAFLMWMLGSRFYRKYLFSRRTVLCFIALLSPPLATRIWLKRQQRTKPEIDSDRSGSHLEAS